MSNLFVFGLGYSALETAERIASGGWPVAGTVRSRDKLDKVARSGIEPILFSDADAVQAALQNASHCLVSVPPDENGDPALAAYRDALLEAPELHWIGYLSTIGVYGDHGGNWVDELTPVAASGGRRSARVEAEIEWTALAKEKGIALDIFRLAGIYGPGRSPLDRIRSGEARWIYKPGQVFNRIHVDDIVQTVISAIRRDRLGGVHIFNVTDDEPAPNTDVLAYAADLIGVPKQPLVPYEEAELSPMARSFYEGNKRVHNAKIKRELGILLRYPTYREGLRALAKDAE